MKATQLITILFSLFIYSSCNVAGLVGVEASLDPSTFNTGKKIF